VSVLSDKVPQYRRANAVVEQIFLPNKTDVLTRNHLDTQKIRDSRISSFVETVMRDGQIGLSFEDNLETAIQVNKLSQPIRDILNEVKEEV
jgi:hypothetical protein